MVEMKRLTLLAIAMMIVTILVSSPLRATSPVINQQSSSLNVVFTRYFAMFMLTLNGDNQTDLLIVDFGDEEIVRGDADDLADGKVIPDGKGDGEIEIVPPGIPEKNVIY
ncbi:MAG TPA: hypothetical protein VLA34_06090 [Candidatus Krumholzibacterium sp.]|nr:hypothetical protein [Candidatus Krumholzibacterium sp.]